MVLTFIT